MHARILVGGVVVFLASVAGIASGQVQYQVLDLGSTAAHTSSYATGINNAGDVVGYYYLDGGLSTVFLYSDGTIQQLLAPGFFPGGNAFGINNFGQIVGDAYDVNKGVTYPFLYSGGTVQKLAEGYYDYNAKAVNDSAQVVGDISFDGVTYLNFRRFSDGF